MVSRRESWSSIPMIDMDRVRADTPAASRRTYLHNAGAALMPVPVVEAIKGHLDL
jgi:cysteine desulfurase/selenocysteine lyase